MKTSLDSEWNDIQWDSINTWAIVLSLCDGAWLIGAHAVDCDGIPAESSSCSSRQRRSLRIVPHKTFNWRCSFKHSYKKWKIQRYEQLNKYSSIEIIYKIKYIYLHCYSFQIVINYLNILNIETVIQILLKNVIIIFKIWNIKILDRTEWNEVVHHKPEWFWRLLPNWMNWDWFETGDNDQYDALMKDNCPVGAHHSSTTAATGYEDGPMTSCNDTGCGLPTPPKSICFPTQQ